MPEQNSGPETIEDLLVETRRVLLDHKDTPRISAAELRAVLAIFGVPMARELPQERWPEFRAWLRERAIGLGVDLPL